MIIWIVLLIILFLCWGSFLNVVGYRIIRNKSLFTRSHCPHCKKFIVWYDLVPLLSWIVLRGSCRRCRVPISPLYFFIELISAFVFTLLCLYGNTDYFLSYFLFFSALIVTIRTDFETMLISRFMTWALIPLAFALSSISMLPISLSESIAGAIFGYVILWVTAKFFYLVKKIEGLGEGDLDLLAMIGSFTGILGAWFSLFIGALLGTIVGLLFIALGYGTRTTLKIAFGPWLASGAILYVFVQSWVMKAFNLF